jgi:hypothetical protein
MMRNKTAKSTRGRDSAPPRDRQDRRQRLGVGGWPFLLIVALLLVSGGLLIGPLFNGRDDSTRPAARAPAMETGNATRAAESFAAVTAGEMVPAPAAAEPINAVDPFTGKPINANSPTVVYKGRTLAFCCASSPGYQGEWARLSEADKDDLIAQYIE